MVNGINIFNNINFRRDTMKKILIGAILIIALMMLYTTAYSQINKSIVVTNKTGVPVTAVYISENGANTYGSNVSTQKVLAEGESFTLMLPVESTACLYDIKYFTSDSKTFYMVYFNFCTASRMTLTANSDRIDNK